MIASCLLDWRHTKPRVCPLATEDACLPAAIGLGATLASSLELQATTPGTAPSGRHSIHHASSESPRDVETLMRV